MNVVKHPHETSMIDIMDGCDSWEIKIGEHGSCSLVDVLPRLVPVGRTADCVIARAARTSTGQGMKSVSEDRSLVRYLYSHAHSTPLEMVQCVFHMVLPIFVARQLVRTRTAKINEYSLRYSEAKDRFWFPTADEIRKQGTKNKQGGDEPMTLEHAQTFVDNLHYVRDEAWQGYCVDIENGVSRELARTQLPVNLMTEWYWSIDLNNLLKTLSLRQDAHAQAEIRVYADAMYELIKPLVPDALSAYDDYNPNRGGIMLSAMELTLLNNKADMESMIAENKMSKREVSEFLEKRKRLGEWAKPATVSV